MQGAQKEHKPLPKWTTQQFVCCCAAGEVNNTLSLIIVQMIIVIICVNYFNYLFLNKIKII